MLDKKICKFMIANLSNENVIKTKCFIKKRLINLLVLVN